MLGFLSSVSTIIQHIKKNHLQLNFANKDFYVCGGIRYSPPPFPNTLEVECQPNVHQPKTLVLRIKNGTCKRISYEPKFTHFVILTLMTFIDFAFTF
jgi:hypothetical protein